MSRARSPILVLVFAAFGLLAAACGSDAEGATVGVASLEDTAGAAETDEEPVDSELSAEDAALLFSECIRDEGIDFPDIGVDAEGNPDLRNAFQDAGLDPRSEEFQDALGGCQSVLEGIGFGGGRRAALGDNPELQDAFVEYSDCIRDQGFDVGDLSLGGGQGGGGQGDGPADGDGPQRGQGQGQGGFGDRNARLAENLGLDADECVVVAERSGLAQQFRHRLFSKIVPNVKSLGLLRSEKQRRRFHELDILQYEDETTSDVDQDIEEERRLRAGEPVRAAG